jgi:hypothetical protein
MGLEEPFDHHLLFDLVTRQMLSREPVDPLERSAVGHGLVLLGLGDVPASRAWRTDEADRDALFAALHDVPDRTDQLMLEQLWSHRVALSAVPFSWDGLLIGHPVLGRFAYDPERTEMEQIADGVVSTAGHGTATAHLIDDFVLKLWGFVGTIEEPTLRELSKICPAVVDLHCLYSPEDFELGPDE